MRNSMSIGRLMGAVGVLTCLPATVVADGSWFENFDSYVLGSGLHGQGGWKGWDNDPTWDAFVSDAFFLSAPHSVDIVANADLVHEYAGKTTGQWVYTAWQYIPSSFVGQTYFILLNTYSDGGAKNWSSQVLFDSSGVVHSDFDGAELPLITNEWVELRVEIDLDADSQTFLYGGTELYTKSWSEGVSGGGALNIGAVDLFANGASSIYYDNMSLVPAPGGVLVMLGAVVFGRQRRRRRL